MNPDLQYKFEKQMLEKGFTKDHRVFNKNSKGVYINDNVWWMYRVWISQEAVIETLISKHQREVEESYMCGYTEAEYDFKYKAKEK